MRRGSESSAPTELELDRIRARAEIMERIAANRANSAANAEEVVARKVRTAELWDRATAYVALENGIKQAYKPGFFGRLRGYAATLHYEALNVLAMSR